MIPNETIQKLETIGQVSAVADFRITNETLPRLFVSLSDKMYNNKELAVIREYSTNAADATVKAGKSINSIIVNLPTYEDLNFKIRDFGEGLSKDDIKNIFCVFGESTKRNSNEFNGVLGYGAKSGFALADAFLVCSWYNGVKTVYQCIKGDNTKLHTIIELSKQPSDEESGIEIVVPIKDDNIWSFHNTAANFYKYWTVLPTINNIDPQNKSLIENWKNVKSIISGNQWELRPVEQYKTPTGVAYMGYVPYSIDWNILYSKLALTQENRMTFEIVKSNNCIIYFNNGDLNFVINREGLEYTDETIDKLSSRLKEIFVEITKSVQKIISEASNIWEAKKLYGRLFNKSSHFVDDEGEVWEDGDNTNITHFNLQKFEEAFKGKLLWNKTLINDPYFKKINRFDNSDCSKVQDEDCSPKEPVMTSYRKHKSRLKTDHSTFTGDSSITASGKTVIIINDNNVKTGIRQVARYLLFKENSKVSNVKVLNFKHKSLRNLFYDEYNFHTVPTINLSEIVDEAKKWCLNNTSPRSTTRNGSGYSRNLMKYIDVENCKVVEEDVYVKTIVEEGGYFVVSHSTRGRKKHRSETLSIICGNEVSTIDLQYNMGGLKGIIKDLDLDINKIYIINKSSMESKWFLDAVKEGELTNFFKYIIDEFPSLVDNVQSIIDNSELENQLSVNLRTASKILSKIISTNSVWKEVFQDISLNIETINENVNLVTNLTKYGCWDLIKNKHGIKNKKSDNQNKSKLIESYPIIMDYNFHYYLNEDFDAKPSFFNKKVIPYINAMDMYNESLKEKSIDS